MVTRWKSLPQRDGEIIFKKYDDNRDIENWVEDIMEKYGNEVRGIYVNGKTITVYTSDGAFKATCTDSDEFKFNVGVAVALAKAYDERVSGTVGKLTEKSRRNPTFFLEKFLDVQRLN